MHNKMTTDKLRKAPIHRDTWMVAFQSRLGFVWFQCQKCGAVCHKAEESSEPL